MSATAREARSAWPLEKFKRALGRYVSTEDVNQLAAVVVSGALAPVDLGHLHMLWQAKARLQAAGYTVCGGWLSPSNDMQVSEKAQSRSTAALSLELRLHLAELATQDDDLISVASWEASTTARIPGYDEVVASLQCELVASLPPALAGRSVSVFMVSSTGNRKNFNNLDAAKGQGLVIVPRRGMDTILEKPAERVFLTEPVPGRLDQLSSERVCHALRSGDTVYVRQALPAAAARLLLQPAPSERVSFGGDLERLSATTASVGPWSCAKLAERIMDSPPVEGRVCALLVASGSMSPLHRGHLLLLRRAKERLESAGYVVLTAWLSPSGESKAQREAEAKGSAKLGSAFRQKVAELSVCEDGFISVGAWEATQDGPARPRELTSALHQHVLERFRHSLEGITVKTFYVCGSDVAEQQAVTKGFQGERDLGVVIVARGDDDGLFMEIPHQMVFTTQPLDGDAAESSSTRLRAMVKAGDTAGAAQAMALAAARFMLAPTAMEHAEFREDFAQLGVALPGASDLAQMQASLKTTLKSWAGPSGSIGSQDLSRLLRMLDPSWTSQELDALLQQAANAADGRVDSDGFVDWIFSGGLQVAAAA